MLFASLIIRSARAKALLRAAHLGPTIAVTAIATVLAASCCELLGTVAVAAAVLSGQLAVGWSNDYIDRERDLRAGRSDKPIVAGDVRAEIIRRAFVLALAACVPLSLLTGWRAALVHLVAVASAMAYNVGLKATVVSPLPFASSFALLPAFVTLDAPGHPLPPWWAAAAAAVFGCGAHFMNTLDDVDTDRRQGVRGLPQRVGVGWSLRLGVAMLAIAACLLAFGPPGPTSAGGSVLLAVAAMMVIGVLISGGRDELERAWQFTVGTAVVVTILLLASGASLT